MGLKQLITRSAITTSKRSRAIKRKTGNDDDSSETTNRSLLSTSSSHSSTSTFMLSPAVRFVAQATVYEAPATAYFYEDEVAELWYTKFERLDCQDDIRSEIRALRTSAYVPYKDGLEAAYRNARFIASTSDEDDLEHALNKSSVVAKHGRGLIEAICELASVEASCRGMEELLSDMYGFERETMINEARSMIISMGEYDCNAFSEETAREYSSLCRTAVVFARLLAEADAICATHL